jgi:hypothetical protein
MEGDGCTCDEAKPLYVNTRHENKTEQKRAVAPVKILIAQHNGLRRNRYFATAELDRDPPLAGVQVLPLRSLTKAYDPFLCCIPGANVFRACHHSHAPQAGIGASICRRRSASWVWVPSQVPTPDGPFRVVFGFVNVTGPHSQFA